MSPVQEWAEQRTLSVAFPEWLNSSFTGCTAWAPEWQSAQTYLVALVSLILSRSPDWRREVEIQLWKVLSGTFSWPPTSSSQASKDVLQFISVWADSGMTWGLALAFSPRGISASNPFIYFSTGDSFVSALSLCKCMTRKCRVDMGIPWQWMIWEFPDRCQSYPNSG